MFAMPFSPNVTLSIGRGKPIGMQLIGKSMVNLGKRTTSVGNTAKPKVRKFKLYFGFMGKVTI
jgi:hypothetical protein